MYHLIIYYSLNAMNIDCIWITTHIIIFVITVCHCTDAVNNDAL